MDLSEGRLKSPPNFTLLAQDEVLKVNLDLFLQRTLTTLSLKGKVGGGGGGH